MVEKDLEIPMASCLGGWKLPSVVPPPRFNTLAGGNKAAAQSRRRSISSNWRAQAFWKAGTKPPHKAAVMIGGFPGRPRRDKSSRRSPR
ncbi:hypothetical protein Q3G72_034987 [Acer saccharum]|nr:hypothetical protein Q3G72_034987 [Acer saccharum]